MKVGCFMKPWARIIIVAYKSGDHLQMCIDALSLQTFSSFEVVIVNNDCPDDCTANLDYNTETFCILDAGENLGFAGGSNFGVDSAETEWVITLNPDAFPQPDWLEKLYSASKKYPEAWCLSSTLLQYKRTEILDGFGDVFSIFGIAWRGGYGQSFANVPDEDVKVFGACGAGAAFKRDKFNLLGQFDTYYFCYLEDVDLAYRLQRTGGSCVQVVSALINHVGSGSVGKGSDFQMYQTYKNNFRLIVKNAPVILLPIQLVLYIVAQKYLLYKNRNNSGDGARRTGFKAGLKDLPISFKARKTNKSAFKFGTFYILSKIAFSLKSVRKQSIKYWPLY